MEILEVLNWIMMGFVLAGIGMAVVVGFINLPAQNVQTIMEDKNVSTVEKGGLFTAMQLGLKSITPAKRVDWLPGGSKGTDYIYLLEDWPLPDEIDAIGFLFIIPFLMLLFRWETGEFSETMLKWFLIILMFPLGFILAKLFYFWLYYWAGAQLGIGTAIMTSIREASLSVYDNVLGAVFILSMTSFVIFVQKLIGMAVDS